MRHDCITDEQGRRACTCANRKPQSVPADSVWDWIDTIPNVVDRALLILVAFAIVAGLIKFFHH